MNILFLTTGRMESISQHAIYTDLLRCFRDNGHSIYTVSSYEKRLGKETEVIDEDSVHMLHVKIGNLTKTNLIEKGISTITIEQQYLGAIKKYFSTIKFDLVMYSTPPITLVKVVEFIKKRDNCFTYLLLKDIFPQNAVDLEMMHKTGIKGVIYRYFRRKEIRLYNVSDYIGCMSPGNVEYVKNNNPQINPTRIGVCPNSIEVIDVAMNLYNRDEIRKKYGVPIEKTVYVYGGNLGKPQGIPFLIECLKSAERIENAFFLIVGDGTEYGQLKAYIDTEKPNNVKLIKRIPKEEYDTMVNMCDVGLIFLDHRFTIPNFPSRMLIYMQAKLPIITCTDPNTDIGKVVQDGCFGWWCESNDANSFTRIIEKSLKTDLVAMGNNAYNYLVANYSVQDTYKGIMDVVSNTRDI